MTMSHDHGHPQPDHRDHLDHAAVDAGRGLNKMAASATLQASHAAVRCAAATGPATGQCASNTSSNGKCVR